jgi:hypothetical protein
MLDAAVISTAALATLAALAVTLLLQRWQLGRLHARLALLEQRSLTADQSAAALAAQLAALQGTVAAVASGAAQARALQSDLCARVEALATRAGGDQPYGDAIRLVRQGAREARLVDELGLSPVEAGLIVRLHGGPVTH